MRPQPPHSLNGIKRLLIVDNDARERLLLRMQLEAVGFIVDEASDGLAALSHAETARPDAVISEVLMPRLDGFGLCRAWKRSPQFKRIPFIIRTGVYVSEQDQAFALAIGADGYHRSDEPTSEILKTLGELPAVTPVTSPPDPGIRASFLEPGPLGGLNPKPSTQQDATVRHLDRAFGGILSVISNMVEQRVPGFRGYHGAVANLATDMALRLRLDHDSIETLRIAAQLHDIGKIMLPVEIVGKTGPLDAAEDAVLQTHAELGYALLKDVPFQGPVAKIIRQHHERPDGQGYPHRLHAGQISREALVIAVADEFVTAISGHPYRPVISADEALASLQDRAGQQFDALAVQACRDAVKRQGADAYQPKP